MRLPPQWSDLYRNVAASDPKLARGQVWCLSCGDTKLVNSAECLRIGWPVCCGATMSLDPPNGARTR